MVNSQLLVIVAIAMVAGVIAFRLYTVLGRRTDNEHEPQERFRRMGEAAGESDTKIARLPELRGETMPAKPLDEIEQALMDIKLADRNFETDHFVAGAKKAHELIVTAFAKSDRETLRSLLSDEVYDAFDRVLKEREERKESVKFTLVGYKGANITHASLKGCTAEITVAFHIQCVSSTLAASGEVIEGDPATVRDVTDIWTFARDVRGRDPNWTLVATSGGEG